MPNLSGMMQNIESPYDVCLHYKYECSCYFFHLSLSRNHSYENDALLAAAIFIAPYVSSSRFF